jgi:hypothetical protein
MGTDARRRPSRLELAAAAFAGVVLAGLAVAEPDVLAAPFQNWRTLLFTFGGTALALVAWALLVRGGVPPAARVVVLGLPFVAGPPVRAHAGVAAPWFFGA